MCSWHSCYLVCTLAKVSVNIDCIVQYMYRSQLSESTDSSNVG